MSKEYDYNRGKIAEECFRNPISHVMCHGDWQLPTDMRHLQHEGDFIYQGKLTEVKSDWGKAVNTGNVCIEVMNRENFGGLGWLDHCIKNNVELLCFMLYQEKDPCEECFPKKVVLVPLAEVKRLLDED